MPKLNEREVRRGVPKAMSERERGGSMQKHTFPRVAAVAVVAMSIAVPRSDAIAQRAE
jgi:hypothetical protein